MNPVGAFQVTPITFGGGVRVDWLNPTDAAYDHVIILRKLTNNIAGPTDPGATLVYTGPGWPNDEFRAIINPYPVTGETRYRWVMDTVGLAWATTYYYAIYAANLPETDLSAKISGKAVVPDAATFEEVDVIGVLMDYLPSYLARTIAQGALRVKTEVTTIPVTDGPPLLDNIAFPVVSLHLEQDATNNFGLGDRVGSAGQTGGIVTRRGYLSSQNLKIIGWAGDNPEVRRSLYRAIKAALTAGRPTLGAYGVINPSLTGAYMEDFESYDMPMFFGVFTLSYTLPTCVVVAATAPLAEIDVHEPSLTATSL